MKVYLLEVYDEEAKQYFLRAEDTPGTGEHSLVNYAIFAYKKVKSPSYNPTHWQSPRCEFLVKNRKTVIQRVIAEVDATDKKDARSKIRSARQSYNQYRLALGWKKVS